MGEEEKGRRGDFFSFVMLKALIEGSRLLTKNLSPFLPFSSSPFLPFSPSFLTGSDDAHFGVNVAQSFASDNARLVRAVF